MIVKVAKEHEVLMKDTMEKVTKILILSVEPRNGRWVFAPLENDELHLPFEELDYAVEIAQEYGGFVLFDAESEDYEVEG